ncbi:hypothetical protein [Shewanella algae]
MTLLKSTFLLESLYQEGLLTYKTTGDCAGYVQLQLRVPWAFGYQDLEITVWIRPNITNNFFVTLLPFPPVQQHKKTPKAKSLLQITPAEKEKDILWQSLCKLY